jgi:hypothetical protein
MMMPMCAVGLWTLIFLGWPLQRSIAICASGVESAQPSEVAQVVCAPERGLVSWWPADGSPDDAVGSNDASLDGGTSFAPGRVRQAFSLDGVDDSINAGNDPSLHLSNRDFSIVAWVYFAELSHPPGGNPEGVPAGDMSIVDKMSAGAVNEDGWRLLKQDDNRFWFCFGGGPGINGCDHGSPTTIQSTTTAVTGIWYHIVVVKAGPVYGMYVNGVLEVLEATAAFEDTHSAELRIGSNALEGAHFNGLIDEVGLYRQALTPGAVVRLYLAGRAGRCPPGFGN